VLPVSSQLTKKDTMPDDQPTYVEEPAAYTYTKTLTSGQHLGQVAVNIDRDSDFLLTGINGSSAGAYTLNFRLPSGRLYSSDEILNTDLLGTANQPTAVGPPPIYRAGSTGPQLDLTDTSGASNAIRIVFSGIRRIRTT
jgi:hypothetical protein